MLSGARSHEGMWTVHLTKHKSRSFRGTAGRYVPLDRVRYSGVVWCPSLPAGTWVARRNGKSFITGNSYPTELARRCILAGTSAKGCCPECGAPWARQIEIGYVQVRTPSKRSIRGDARRDPGSRTDLPTESLRSANTTTGWRPTCSDTCAGHQSAFGAHIPIPCTVLDPFFGSGRTGLACEELGRDCIGIELNPKSVAMAHAQIERAKASRMIGDVIERMPTDERQGLLL
jgi:hypothetical protein